MPSVILKDCFQVICTPTFIALYDPFGSSPGIPLQRNIIADSARIHPSVNGGNRPLPVGRPIHTGLCLTRVRGRSPGSGKRLTRPTADINSYPS